MNMVFVGRIISHVMYMLYPPGEC